MSKMKASLLLSAALFCVAGGPAAIAATAALSGQVTSAKEGAMEGVLVTAKKDGSTVAVTVVSDAKGQFSFPADRLGAGHYTIRIRAFGYDLDGPKTVDVPAAGDAMASVKLVPTKDLAAQMTNAEWLASAPGDIAQKKSIYTCDGCHTLARPLNSTHTAEEFQKDVFPRMVNYSSQAYPQLIQVREVKRDPAVMLGRMGAVAEYLASINLSKGPNRSYELKGFARPKGEATKVIITEYDLPRKTMQPHDVVVDDKGTVWFSNFGENALAKLDPKSAKVTEYKYQPTRPGYANGNLDLEFDKTGHIWIAMMNQTGFAVFDPQASKFDFHPLPAVLLDGTTQQAMVAPTHWNVDNKVWYNNAEDGTLGRVDMKTGKYDPWWNLWDSLPKNNIRHGVYGLYSDSHNNVFFCDFGADNIGRVDAKTGAVTFYKVPTPDSRPRRGRMDDQDRLWFAEWRGDKVGMLDTKTGQIKEWTVPGQFPAPYDVVADRFGEVWTGNDNDDRITRIDTTSGHAVQYLMPHEINVRRVFVDDKGAKPVFWTGSNHTASIFKVEPLE